MSKRGPTQTITKRTTETQDQRMQKFIRYYKRTTGAIETNMAEVVALAVKMGWPLPKPKTPVELLEKAFSKAAGNEERVSKRTKRPYKANLAISERTGTLWIDVDEAPRHRMLKGLHQYREQMVGEAVIATNTVEHWNSLHPREEPLNFELNFGPDVSWRYASEEEEVSQKAS